MKVQPQFYSFAAGEVDPELRDRVDIEASKHGAKQMVNMIGKSTGPAGSRGGSRVLDEWTDTAHGRLLSGHHGIYGKYSFLILDDGYIYLLSPCGVVADVCCINDLEFFLQDIAAGNLTYTAPAYAVTAPEVVRLYSDKGEVASVDFDWDPIIYANVQFTIRFKQKAPAGTTVEIIEDTGSEVVLATYEADNSDYIHGTATASGTTNPLIVRVSLESDTPALVEIVSLNTNWVSPESQLRIAHTYEARHFSQLHVTQHPTDHSLIITHNDYQPKRIYEATAAGPGSCPDVHYIYHGNITFTAQPAEWTAGNYPAVCGFFQGRSWWAGTREEGNYLWASKSASYYDMTTGAAADDAMEFIRTTDCNIRGLYAAKKLLIGTDIDEFILASDDSGGLLAPTTVLRDEPQSAHGSSLVSPVILGDSVLYVGADGIRIWEAKFSWTDDLWKSRHINFSAMHLFRGKTIKEIHYARDPDSLLFVVFVDGSAVIGRYDTPNNIINWQPYTCLRFIESAVVLNRVGRDYLFLLTAGLEDDLSTPITFMEEYTPDVFLDHFEEYRAESGSYTATYPVSNNIESIRQAHDNLGDNRIKAADWSFTTGAFDATYAAIAFATSGTGKAVDAAPSGGWASTYVPKYILVSIIKRTITVGYTWAPITLDLYAGTTQIVNGATEIEAQHGTSEILARIDWQGEDTITRLLLTSANPTAATTVYAARIAFFDTLEEYKAYRRFLQMILIDYQTFDEELHMIPQQYQGAAASVFFGPSAVIRFAYLGVSFLKKLVTLAPKLDMVTGSGKAASRGGNRIQVSVLDSYPPTVNDKPTTVDADADAEDDDLVNEGLVRATIRGNSNDFNLAIEQNDARNLTVRSIQIEMDQSTV